MKQLTLHLLFFVSTFPVVNAQEWLSGEGWAFFGENAGVKVYTRTNPETSRLEAKATYTFENQGAKYLNRLRIRWTDVRLEERITNYPKNHRIIQADATSRTVYMVPDLPFFMKEREIIVKQTTSPLTYGQGLVTYARAEPDLLPRNDTYIRVEDFSAVWVARVEAEKLLIALRFNIDPGGGAPEAIIRKFVEGGAERDVLRLVDILTHDEWFAGLE